MHHITGSDYLFILLITVPVIVFLLNLFDKDKP